jgi:ribosomal protein L37E
MAMRSLGEWKLSSYSRTEPVRSREPHLPLDLINYGLDPSSVGSHWSAAKKRSLEERAASLREYFGKMGVYHDSCDNCGRKSTETTLFRCAACRFNMHCSKEWQKSAWKAEHKKACGNGWEEARLAVAEDAAFEDGPLQWDIAN